MPAWRRSGAAVLLLAVICATAGCAASQQQQQQQQRSTRAVRGKLLPLVSRLESRMVTLNSRLYIWFNALDSKLVKLSSQMYTLGSRLESRVDELDRRLVQLDSRVDEFTDRLSLLENRQNLQLDELPRRLDSQQIQLDELVAKLHSQTLQLDEVLTIVNTQKFTTKALTTQLGSQDSQVTGLMTKQDSQQSQLAVLTNNSNRDRSRLDGAINKTVSQQTHIDELAVRLEQAEVEQVRVKHPPRDCSELAAGATSGVYFLMPDLDRYQESFCDMNTNRGNWTVFQRRNETGPHQDFQLGWTAYKQGFGDLTGEFWWGLAHLHQVTSKQDRKYELRIELEDFDGNQAYAMYQGFRISSEADGYMLSVSNYTGDAGDSLRYLANPKFSTPDRDQDGWSDRHCAQLLQAAWWYGDGGGRWWCDYSNLNGRYRSSGSNDLTGIRWRTWNGGDTLKKTEMKIRPI